MENRNNFKSFLTGLTAGIIAGAAAGVLLAPKSGEETRKDLAELGEKIKKNIEDQYKIAKKEVNYKIEQVKKLGEKIDEKKYKEVINNVIEELKADAVVTKEASKEISAQLQKDWGVVKKEMSKKAPSRAKKKSKNQAIK